MKGWLRRFCGCDEKRGTLTFLPDGRVIVGTPADATQEEAYRVIKGVRDWLENTDRPQVLVFPWPVDVVDRR